MTRAEVPAREHEQGSPEPRLVSRAGGDNPKTDPVTPMARGSTLSATPVGPRSAASARLPDALRETAAVAGPALASSGLRSP